MHPAAVLVGAGGLVCGLGWDCAHDPRLRAAIVGRLTYGGNIIETGTDSYRLAQTRARADATAMPSAG